MYKLTDTMYKEFRREDLLSKEKLGFLSCRRIGHNGLILKKSVDIIGSFILLILFFPIMLLAGFLIKITSKGPVCHVRERVGKDFKPFKMRKFRTMTVDAEKQEEKLRLSDNRIGPFFKVKNDTRVTSLGRFMRKYSIDELPQMINVLKGEMSLVGPRPIFYFEVQEFDEWKQLRRFSMKPGLTCIWQVNGRSNSSAEDRLGYDLEYVDDWSLMLDTKLLLKSIPAVLRGAGAV